MRGWMGGIAAVMLLTVLLAGCGESPGVQSGANDQGSEAWPRTYVDALGREVVIEKKPERVALLFFRNFEHVFLLGEAPIAATDIDVLEQWASLAPHKSNPIADLGSITSPNAEKLLDLEPDLIVAFSGRYEGYGDLLGKIAPVVTVNSNENNWQGALREYGVMFGKEDTAEAEIARIEALIADSRKQLEKFSDQSFAVIMLGDKQFWAFTTQFVYNKENGLGLNPPRNYVDMSTKGEQISLEGLAGMNPDYMFVADLGGSADRLKNYLNNLAGDPVWNSLDAVKNGRMFPLDSSITAGGPLGIELGVITIVDNLLAQ